MEKRKVIFAGTPEFAATGLQALIDNQETLNIELVAVYTQPDRKAGRGQKLTASPVKQLAQQHGIPVEQPVTFKKSTDAGQQARTTLASYTPDVMVVAAYGLILPLGVLNTPKHGCVNIHASVLPRWRGAAPIHRAILAGDDETGVTIMQMNLGLDTGDMLYQLTCPIEAEDTSQTVHDRLALLGGQAIVTVLADLPNFQQQAQPQHDHLACYADKLTKKEGQINWQQSAKQIDRHIRGLQPWPVAYTELNGNRVRVLGCALRNNKPTDLAAGTVASVGKNAVLVACGDGHYINLIGLQWAGGKPLTAEQVCNSNKINDGDCFV